MEKIEAEHPLEMDWESDARYIWPKRWAKAEARVEELETALHDLLLGTLHLELGELHGYLRRVLYRDGSIRA
jgi:hypothetical protein